MKRLLLVLVVMAVGACYGQQGGEEAGDVPAAAEMPVTADTPDVRADTIMARDTAF